MNPLAHGAKTRRGSIFLVSMAIAISMLGIAYLFVRSARADIDSSLLSRKAGLAMNVAEQGRDMALKLICDDFANGTTIGADVLKSTHLDSGWARAVRPFSKFDRNAPEDEDDVREEDALQDPYCGWNNAYQFRREGYTKGYQYAFGRGKWMEPCFHSDPVSAPIRFTDLGAVATHAVEGFYDASLRPYDTGDARADRRNARYRTRFANTVDDLEGMILANPLPDYDYRQLWSIELNQVAGTYSGTPAAYPDPADTTGMSRQEKQRQAVNRHRHAYANLVSAILGDIRGNIWGMRAEHVFLGRGMTGNFAKAVASAPSTYAVPVTFSHMFRGRHPFSPNDMTPEFFAAYESTPGGAWNVNVNTTPALELYTNTLMGAAQPMGMAEIKADYYGKVGGATGHNLVGPQFSPLSVTKAWEGYSIGWEGVTTTFFNFCFTPFGRAQVAEDAHPLWLPANNVARNAYQWGFKTHVGPVETPWCVNMMTAPPKVIHGMLTAYLPAYVKTLKYTSESFYNYLGTKKVGGAPGYSGVIVTNPLAPGDQVSVSVGTRDLQIAVVSKAFAAYDPPTVDGVTPNFQRPDPKLAYPGSPGYDAAQYQPAKRYPGAYMTGVYDHIAVAPALRLEGEDDMGELINTSALPMPSCPYTAAPFQINYGGALSGTRADNGWKTTPPAGWTSTNYSPGDASYDADPSGNQKNQYTKNLDPTVYKFVNSYWWDVVRAAAQAVAVMRAQWKVVPDEVCAGGATAFPDDGNGSNGSEFLPGSHMSIRDLDYAFLRQLGEIPTAPGTAAPPSQGAFTYTADSNGWNQVYRRCTIDENIYSLSHSTETYPARNGTGNRYKLTLNVPDAQYALIPDKADYVLQRSRAMELVLNDFRVSFFGASPQYHTDFRPMDFNGDGRAECSAYPAGNAAATAGYGPALSTATDNWFCLTGTFRVGYSRFFRVWTRGELYDNYLRKPVSRATLETVLAVDPDGSYEFAAPGAGSLRDTHVIYQRWLYHKGRATLPASYP
ncbi:MAG: hypothetical protein J0M02_06545 [Planctomycetes bacterium]|nr:hypothetical protein [Planctomycetota bacterium]